MDAHPTGIALGVRKIVVADYMQKLAAGIPHLPLTFLEQERLKAALRALMEGTPV
jgi:hypothetical protein